MKYIMTELPSSGVKNYIYFDYYSDLYRPMPEEPTMKMLGAIATVISAAGNVNYYLCTLKENELVWEEILDNGNLRTLVEELRKNLSTVESQIELINKRIDSEFEMYDSELAAIVDSLNYLHDGMAMDKDYVVQYNIGGYAEDDIIHKGTPVKDVLIHLLANKPS